MSASSAALSSGEATGSPKLFALIAATRAFARARPQPRAGSPEQPGVRRIWVDCSHGDSDVMDDHIAWTCQQRLDAVAIATVMARVVVLAQSRLGVPRADQHELTRLFGGEHSKAGALRLGPACIDELAQKRAQLGLERGPSVHICDQEDAHAVCATAA